MDKSDFIKTLAIAICEGCDERPTSIGDARGNDFRWQDYEGVAQHVISKLNLAPTHLKVKPLVFKQKTPRSFTARTSYGPYKIYKEAGSFTNEAGEPVEIFSVTFRDGRGKIATGFFDEVVQAANETHRGKIESEILIEGCDEK